VKLRVAIRDADASECERLSALAFASKAYWGYDDGFMEACRAELTVRPDDLSRMQVRLAWHRSVVGFYGLDDGELVWFFVHPDAMGQGVGHALFRDACTVARVKGLQSLRIEADPNAAAFYERMGAVRVGETPSQSIAGRVLPVYAIAVS
jgi:GNAT superfamily N-acetyltransferase